VKSLVSRAVAQVRALLQSVQVKQVLSIVLVGFLLLTTNGTPRVDKQATIERAKADAHQLDNERPKTTGEWFKEADQVEGQPDARFENIVDESKQAIKEFGDMYKDTAERSLRGLNEDRAN
jgi:hypothetical protein